MSKCTGWEVKEITDNVSNQLKAIEFIKENEVYVGIQQKDTSREDDNVTNAELLFIHTNGSPIRNIPVRPVIEPALKAHSQQLSKIMLRAAKCALNGDFSEAMKQLNMAGMRGRDVSKLWFTNPKNHWPTNSPEVIERKMKKGATDPKPLIDTGELRNAISYFVKTKGRQKK